MKSYTCRNQVFKWGQNPAASANRNRQTLRSGKRVRASAATLGCGRPYNIDRLLTFEWGSIIVRGSLCGRSKHRRRPGYKVSRFATGESESSGCLIEHPRLTSGSTAGGGADGPVHGSPSARSARFVRGDKTCSPASDRGVRPSRAADDASHEGKAEAQRYSDFASKDEDHDGGGR
jgi:hypothetical protein